MVTHPDTNPATAGQGTLVNFSISCSEGTLKLVVKEVVRELENYQHVSPEANVSHFPFIFFNLSGFSTMLVMTCLLRLFTQDFYHGTMIDNTKTIYRALLELHITQGQLESPGRQHTAQLTFYMEQEATSSLYPGLQKYSE